MDDDPRLTSPALLFRAVFDGALDAMLLADDEGRYVDVNPAACELFGAPREQLIGRRLHDFTDLDLTDTWATFREGAGTRGTFALRRPDGTTRDLEFSATANIVPRLHLAVMRDVTTRNLAQRDELRAAAALRESEQRYRVLVEHSPEPTLVHVDSRIAFANEAAARALGVPRAADLEGRSIVEFVAPESLEALSRRMAIGPDPPNEPVVRQSFVRVDDGRVVTFEVAFNPIVYEGRPAMLTVARDITQTHEAERERERLIASLEFERQRLGLLLQEAPAFMAVLRGPDHVYELVNNAYYDLVGVRELIGRPLRKVLPELAARLSRLLDGVLRTGEPFVLSGAPVSVPRAPGAAMEIRFVKVMCRALVEADGTRSGVFMHGIDVTDETLAQRRIRAQFNGVPVPTYVWQRAARDESGELRLVDFNDAAVQISRGRIADFVGWSARDYFSEESGITADLERCLVTGATFQREMEHTLRTSGEARRLLVTYACSLPDIVLAHAEDVTARHGLEEQLRQAQKMEAVGRLAGGVAHDFNNLLTVILSYCTFLLDGLDPTDPMRADMEEIQRAGERAVELTRQLLAFSRQQVLQPQVISLDAVLMGLQKMLLRVLGEDVELSLLPACGGAEVFADPGQIEQVIMNLVVNARDAMPSGGRLTIATTEVERAAVVADSLELAPGTYVVLAVSDTGDGMDDATRARVFEPFFTTKGLGKGTGLGLSTVFGIVHQSGGDVSVDSDAGRGTTFKVYLPRAVEASGGPSSRAPPGPVRGGSETVLLVEDEDAVRTIARTVLSRGGYRVLEAKNGAEALLLSEQFAEPIDLLITDVVMPRMSGRQVAERLCATRPQMKLIYMSGYTDDAVVHHGVFAAGVAFLQKPVTPDPLLRKVRDVLDARRSSPPPTG